MRLHTSRAVGLAVIWFFDNVICVAAIYYLYVAILASLNHTSLPGVNTTFWQPLTVFLAVSQLYMLRSIWNYQNPGDRNFQPYSTKDAILAGVLTGGIFLCTAWLLPLMWIDEACTKIKGKVRQSTFSAG